MIIVAAFIYCATMTLGIVAQATHRRFGSWHHIGYFGSCLAAIASAITEPTLWLTCPILCLVSLPITKAGSTIHRSVGTLGAAGWIVAVVSTLL